MKNRKRQLTLIILAIAVLVAGTVYAYMYKKTQTILNTFESAEVSCDVIESFDGTNKSSVQIKNTGTIPAYLRLRMVSYWVDEDGNIVGKKSDMPTVSYDSSKWIKGSSDMYYYKTPVAAEGITDNLLSANMELKTETYHNIAVYQVVEIFAEAIQAEPSGAVTGSWNVTVDDSGNITTEP